MSKVETKYANSEEKFAKAVVLYGDSDDGHLFLEKTHTTKVSKDFVMNAFLKGLLVVFNTDTYYKPTCCKESGGAALVTVHNDTGNLSFYSEEHMA